uniref:ATP synthase F0 subunit 8 n=1 Tax=Cypridina dentata TaxID=1483471 RepID=A0A4D6TK38_9CRUS|nr:ATP synthase F0 subunit 8 [Cypridina dentata]QCG82517.1 ATP synthase F0 subunit 8 [Cypridina dentata]
MAMVSPQQWMLMYFAAILVYLITFSKISTTQSITSQTKPQSHKNFTWSW